MMVLHYTAMQSATAARDWLCNPEAGVSAHYVICEKGRIWQLVEEDQRAWHAGVGQWGDCTDVNSRSIGIELANTGAHPFPDPQMVALEGLLSGIMRRWAIAPERIIGHSDMAPGRKIDPGPRFDWHRLAMQGLAVWPEADHTGRADLFGVDAARFGYGVTACDPKVLLKSFRMRFRPWGRGPLDAMDCALMRDLARRFPVDQPRQSA